MEIAVMKKDPEDSAIGEKIILGVPKPTKLAEDLKPQAIKNILDFNQVRKPLMFQVNIIVKLHPKDTRNM